MVVDWLLGTVGCRRPLTVEIEFEGKARWIIVGLAGLSSIWGAVLDDRSVQAYRISNGLWTPTDLNTSNVSPHRPPLLNVDRDLQGRLLLRSDDCASQAFPVI